jgi:hypothetical protein
VLSDVPHQFRAPNGAGVPDRLFDEAERLSLAFGPRFRHFTAFVPCLFSTECDHSTGSLGLLYLNSSRCYVSFQTRSQEEPESGHTAHIRLLIRFRPSMAVPQRNPFPQKKLRWLTDRQFFELSQRILMS